ncbi:MAG: hypothetical protein HY670_04170 [Chloroflexi bacterium]|nr:hypothetical protein [Chloroflexota bacterium]
MVVETRSVSKLSERVAREKEALLSATPRFDTERIRCLLEAYSETEGQPALLRRARYFEKMCLEREIYIDDNPLVGTLTRYKYGGSVYPETGCRWMRKEKTVQLQRGGEIHLTDEERQWLNRAADYWESRNVFNRTQEIIKQTLGVDIGLFLKCGIATEVTPGAPTHPPCDFGRVLQKGLNGIIAEIETEMKKLDIGNYDDLNKWYFYTASLTCLNAMKALAERYAALAEAMAAKETNPARKQELDRMAETCRRVPAEVPRSFAEAMQSLWFCLLGVWIEIPVTLVGAPLRFPQYMYPFYQKDKKEGIISDEEAIELIQLFFLRLNSLAGALPPHGRKYSSSRLGLQLAIGGLTGDGEDATNELDWLVLKAQKSIQLPEPLLGLMYHKKLSQDFLLECADLVKSGIGQPAFHNLDVAIQRHLYHDHMTLEEARGLAVWGCVQSVLPGHSYGHWEGYLNMPKMAELVLNNGKDPLTGVQIGLQTGAAEDFASFDQFYAAVRQQIHHFIPLLRQTGRVAFNIARDIPVPYSSAVGTHDCVKSGKDETEGGTKYPVGNGVCFVGTVDLANSLAAIKSLVFEKKKYTLPELKKALAANFVGYDELYRDCLAAPKYGNDDDAVDAMVKDLYAFCWDEHQGLPDFLGNHVKPEAYSVIAHVALGRFTGALPSGRKTGLALTDASVSAQPGTDRNGPTALVKSAARALDPVKYGCNHFNMKFHPSALKGMEGTKKFLSLIETYFDLGGYHAQFNCVSGETLRDAQAHPESYRNLVVRVAGFSAYFVTLDKETQDELVKRTELQWS